MKKEKKVRKSRGRGDAQSVYSMATTVNHTNLNDSPKQGIEVDYGFTIGKPRAYHNTTPTLKRLGIDKYDHFEKITDLKFNSLKKVNTKYIKDLRTVDPE